MRLILTVVLLLGLTSPLVAQQQNTDIIASVTKVERTAVAMQDALPRALSVGSEIQLGDIISTGKGARVQLTFEDGSTVNLGERTQFSVIEFVIEHNGGNAVMRLLEGAMEMSSGSMMQLAEASMTVQTETATIGIRGTRFWAGTLGDVPEIALFDGKGVDVENLAGKVSLTRPGTGTAIANDRTKPTAPKAWGKSKLNSAAATTAFSN